MKDVNEVLMDLAMERQRIDTTISMLTGMYGTPQVPDPRATPAPAVRGTRGGVWTPERRAAQAARMKKNMRRVLAGRRKSRRT
jgi:hypothetical protein